MSRVKQLEWQEVPVPPSGESLSPSPVGLYCIPHSGNRFYLHFRDKITLGDYSTLEKAKAAAQADYEQRILSTLKPEGEQSQIDLRNLADQIAALTLHPTTSDDYCAGYIAARNDAFAIIQEAIDNA